jgi:hypothetical protein
VRTVVVAPRATIPPHSLIRAAVTNVDGETGWERGLTYAPETPGGYRAFTRCSDATYDDLPDGPTPVVDFEPWELQVEYPCDSTFGYDRPRFDEELRRALDATESYAIARELWAGDLTRAAATAGDITDDERNLALVIGPEVLNDGDPVAPKHAVGILEEAVGHALRGGQAYLHVGRRVQPLLADLARDGNLLTTRVGNLVVADAGYPGTPPAGVAPAAGVGWLYGTGTVVVRRSAVFPPDPDSAVIDTTTNRLILRTGRVVAATFDRSAHFAVPVDLTA